MRVETTKGLALFDFEFGHTFLSTLAGVELQRHAFARQVDGAFDAHLFGLDLASSILQADSRVRSLEHLGLIVKTPNGGRRLPGRLELL